MSSLTEVEAVKKMCPASRKSFGVTTSLYLVSRYAIVVKVEGIEPQYIPTGNPGDTNFV